jgi:hypothetical protein
MEREHPGDDFGPLDPHDYDADECWQCHGEGFVYSCHTEYACIDPEGGCDLCERVCDVCFPAKRKE